MPKYFPVLMFFMLFGWCVHASEKSRSMVFNSQKSHIYSANFDAGSVSIIERSSGSILVENTIGRDIRRLALSADEKRLLASDYLNDQAILLDANTLQVIKTIKVPARPFGVTFDKRHQQFYLTSFAQHQLLVISTEGEIKATIATAKAPRGLALTDDGRLLVTHAMSGEVSVFTVDEAKPQLTNVVQLRDTPFAKTPSTPQGKPRLLDNIAISPDGKTAWLPHLLWSFGDDFQFQSSVFPAVSLLDLSDGKVRELVDQRKLLFKQINIVESGSKVRIVSNPHDVTFTEDGKKVIVSLAGSEDLLVFDLSRSMAKNKRNKKRRHRRKKHQGGVKASQIYRNVPGDNPRGLLIDGRHLYVQNAMSLDIAEFDTGPAGPFAKLKLVQPKFAPLVSRDPLAGSMRLGKTLFNRANTADNPSYPMSGDFWMSCNSCHLDGFNFTNKQLMKDGLKDKYRNATTGHVDSIKMIAGDPIAAYINMIQKTQGGMGADSAGDAPLVDIEQPPLAVVKMMSALNEYVRAPENLPYLSTWLRLDDDKPYTHPSEWINSAQCKDCHTTLYDQWADSNHGMNMDHPFYRFQEDLAAKIEGEDFRIFCRGCHAPQMVLNNDSGALSDFGNIYEKKAASLNEAYAHGRSVSERGTGCLFCHRISKVEDAGGNADLTVNLKDRNGYVFEGMQNQLMQWLSSKQINASPDTHKKAYSNPALYQSSSYCATCHNEFTSGPGASVNDNYGEWLASPFNAPDDPDQHKSCIDCHMTQDVSDFSRKVAGQSTNGGPDKANLRNHHFVGGNYYLSGMRSAQHKQLSIDLLKNALTLDVQKQGNVFTAKVTNANSGHHMPGGSRRQVWLEVIATDADGRQVFVSGVIKQGYIPDEARKFSKITVDKDGESVGLRFWRYFKIAQDTRIKSGETRHESYQLPANIRYPLQVSTRILYQVFKKQLTQMVREAYPQQDIPEPQIIELVKMVKTFEQ